MTRYAWLLSPHDGFKHAFDLEAHTDLPYLEAVCTHTVVKDDAIDKQGPFHMACLVKVGEQLEHEGDLSWRL